MKYTDKEEIGRGGFGLVSQVLDDKGNKLALKEFSLDPKMSAISVIAKKRFIKEAIYQQQLQHLNVVEIFDVYSNENPPYFTMRLADSSMRKDLDEKYFDDDRFQRCIYDIMAGLEEMHNYAMYHRDLKPANVLRFDETYAISDFGLMSMNKTGITTLTQTGMAKGTDFYTAPEITQDLKYASVQSDIYSLACILHDFVGNSNRIPCHEINESGAYGDLLLGATRLDASRRFSSVASFREALTSILQGANPVKTALGESIIEILDKDINDFNETDVETISNFLSSTVVEDEKEAILSVISLKHIRVFVKFPIHGTFVAKYYFDYVRNGSFVWTFCDTLANRVQEFMKIGTIDILSEGAFALLYMGTSHNRFFVERKAYHLFSGEIEEKLLKRMVMEIRVDSGKFCNAFKHLKYSINLSNINFHDEIQKVVKQIC